MRRRTKKRCEFTRRHVPRTAPPNAREVYAFDVLVRRRNRKSAARLVIGKPFMRARALCIELTSAERFPRDGDGGGESDYARRLSKNATRVVFKKSSSPRPFDVAAESLRIVFGCAYSYDIYSNTHPHGTLHRALGDPRAEPLCILQRSVHIIPGDAYCLIK